MIGKNTLITDNPQLNIRLNPLSHIDIYKYVLWGNDRNDIEKYAKKHSEKLFLTSFDNKLSNVVNINNTTAKINTIIFYILLYLLIIY